MVIAIAALPVHPPLMARSVTVKVPATTAVFVTYPIVAALLIANAAQSWAVTSQTIGNHHQGARRNPAVCGLLRRAPARAARRRHLGPGGI
jgi:hypothetical protein